MSVMPLVGGHGIRLKPSTLATSSHCSMRSATPSGVPKRVTARRAPDDVAWPHRVEQRTVLRGGPVLLRPGGHQFQQQMVQPVE
jgi:hypothetical protein